MRWLGVGTASAYSRLNGDRVSYPDVKGSVGRIRLSFSSKRLASFSGGPFRLMKR